MLAAVSRRRGHFEQEIEIRGHRLVSDEPESLGGTDRGARPTELLAASLASCTAITLVMYAERKGWDLGELEVAVEYAVPEPGKSASIQVRITVPVELSGEQIERLLTIARKCPVHRTLASKDLKIEDELRATPA
jgi:putative redox protein